MSVDHSGIDDLQSNLGKRNASDDTRSEVTEISGQAVCEKSTASAAVNSVFDGTRRGIKSTPGNLMKEIPDVKHMERALVSLLQDFHSGKLNAFGCRYSIEQMKRIREQQENLAKLHFELAATNDAEPISSFVQINTTKANEAMTYLVEGVEQLSISIENLQTTPS